MNYNKNYVKYCGINIVQDYVMIVLVPSKTIYTDE